MFLYSLGIFLCECLFLKLCLYTDYALCIMYNLVDICFTMFIVHTYIKNNTEILEVNLFAFDYRLFRRDFSPLDGTLCIGIHSIFPSLYVFYVNLGGFYEWVVSIFF